MSPLVVDASMILAANLEDEEHPEVAAVLRRVAAAGCVVPGVWWYEVRNAFLMNERRGRITPNQVANALADCRDIRFERDTTHDEAFLLELARRHRLTIYDASYLEVALRRNLPLATLDRRLAAAARESGVAVCGEEPNRDTQH